MTTVVADTDVVSLIFKDHSLSDKYLDAIDGKNAVLSFMTLAELELWTERCSRSGGRRFKFCRPDPYLRSLGHSSETATGKSRGHATAFSPRLRPENDKAKR